MNLGDRIKQRMDELDWDAQRLSRESRVPYPTLMGIIAGHQKTSTKTPHLAQALGVSPLWLADGKGPKSVQSDELNLKQRPGEAGNLSQNLTPDDLILAAAERWVLFEEAGGEKFHAVRRLERLMELVRLIQADGGSLSPEHAQEIIEAKRARAEGATQHGRQERGRNGKH